MVGRWQIELMVRCMLPSMQPRQFIVARPVGSCTIRLKAMITSQYISELRAVSPADTVPSRLRKAELNRLSLPFLQSYATLDILYIESTKSITLLMTYEARIV
jgi:hypothetical protein